jgi:hypothetical protein
VGLLAVISAVAGKQRKCSGYDNQFPSQGVFDMSVDDVVRVGANARATIRSVPGVGDVYVDPVPDLPAGPYLADRAAIPIERTEVPEQIAPVLDKLPDFVHSVPNDGIQTFLDAGCLLTFRRSYPLLRGEFASGDHTGGVQCSGHWWAVGPSCGLPRRPSPVAAA